MRIRPASTCRPALRLAAGILIANHHRCLHFFQEFFQRIVRRPADDKSHAALIAVLLQCHQTLVQKHIVPQVRMRKIRDSRKERDHWHAQSHSPRGIRRIQRRVVNAARSARCIQYTTHLPVFQRKPGAAHQHARVVGDLLQLAEAHLHRQAFLPGLPDCSRTLSSS